VWCCAMIQTTRGRGARAFAADDGTGRARAVALQSVSVRESESSLQLAHILLCGCNLADVRRPR
jgi:hypothetical protein